MLSEYNLLRYKKGEIMSDKDGWIKISKSLFKQSWYYHANRGALWAQLIGMANYSLDENGVDRGQFKASIKDLEAETGLSTQQLRDAIAFFEQEEMISVKRVGLLKDGKIYTILKYGEYQGMDGRYTTLLKIKNKQEKPMDKGSNDDLGSQNINREQTKEQTEGQTKEQTELPINIDSNAVTTNTTEQTDRRSKEQVISNSYIKEKEGFKNGPEGKSVLSVDKKREILQRELNRLKTPEDDRNLMANRIIAIWIAMLKFGGVKSLDYLTRDPTYTNQLKDAERYLDKFEPSEVFDNLLDFLIESSKLSKTDFQLKKRKEGWFLSNFINWISKPKPEPMYSGSVDLGKLLGIPEPPPPLYPEAERPKSMKWMDELD